MLVVGCVSAMGVAPLFAQVYTGTLADLANGGTLTIGDKTFSNFSWQNSDGLLNSQAANLIVTASIGSDGVYYLDFGGGLIVNNLQGTSDLVGDLKLNYTITANPGLINMIDQQYTPAPNATPASGQIIIGETVKNNLGIIVANSTLTLSPSDLIDPQPEAGDNLNINPGANRLSVVKDILIDAYAGNSVGLNDVQQSFHQVPEPGTMLLGGLGGGLLWFLRSRRQAKRN